MDGDFMNEEKNTIYCSRCGAEMSDNSRYCMKCGNLNYNHDANEGMRPFIENPANETYQVGSGKFAVQNSNDTSVHTMIGNNTGNKKLCFLFTFFTYVLSLGICFLLNHTNLTIYYFISVVVVSFFFLYVYALELIFMKSNKTWWSALIPVYNGMVLSDITFHKSWIGILLLIPIVGQVLFLILLYRLGKSFRYSGILTALLSIIYILLIGYGNHFYEGHAFTESIDDNKFLEKEYKYKKIFLTFISICLVISFGVIAFFHSSDIKKIIKSFSSYYYVYAAKRIVSKTEKAFIKQKFECKKNTSSEPEVYYFFYYDLGDYIYLPLYMTRDSIEGYVKVVVKNGEYQYYVSLGDSNKKIPETEIHFINTDSVIDMEFEDIDRDSVLSCDIY